MRDCSHAHSFSSVNVVSFSSLSMFFGGFFCFFVFLSALGLHCCARAFSSCGKLGLLFIAVRRLLIAVASLVAEHRL